MAAYIIAEIEWHDEDAWSEYRMLVGPNIAQHGGEIVAAGRSPTPLEGEFTASSLIVIRFDSSDKP